jgi:hypothetical protein
LDGWKLLLQQADEQAHYLSIRCSLRTLKTGMIVEKHCGIGSLIKGKKRKTLLPASIYGVWTGRTHGANNVTSSWS